MNTDQINSLVPIAATLDQRGRGPTDAVMMNLQVARPLAHSRTTNHYDESQQAYVYHENIDGKVYESSEAPTLRDFQKDTPMVIAEALRTKRPGEGGIAGDDTHIVAASLMGHGGLHDSGGQQTFVTAFDHCLQGSDRTFIHRKNEQAQLQANRPDAVAGNFGVRRLTPRECERLQGFPDDWTLYDAGGKEISDSARYRMLGNAVCVNVAEWIGRRIMAASVTMDLNA